MGIGVRKLRGDGSEYWAKEYVTYIVPQGNGDYQLVTHQGSKTVMTEENLDKNFTGYWREYLA